MVAVSNEHLLNRIRAEFMEMPGLRLTREQVQRLCGVEQTLCQPVLDRLVETKFLRVSVDGMYARLGEGDVARPRPAKAHRTPDQRVVKAS